MPLAQQTSQRGVALPKVIYKGPPTDLLEKLVNATNNQVKQDNEYQKAQLNLQKKRMAAMGIDVDEDDNGAADDEDAPDGRKAEKTNYDHICLPRARSSQGTLPFTSAENFRISLV